MFSMSDYKKFAVKNFEEDAWSNGPSKNSRRIAKSRRKAAKRRSHIEAFRLQAS